MRNYYVPGAWNAICDRCKFKRKSFELKLEWTGLMVCEDTCWEPRHPQDLLRPKQERPPIPWARPEDTINSLASNSLSTEDVLGLDINTEVDFPLLTE